MKHVTGDKQLRDSCLARAPLPSAESPFSQGSSYGALWRRSIRARRESIHREQWRLLEIQSIGIRDENCSADRHIPLKADCITLTSLSGLNFHLALWLRLS